MTLRQKKDLREAEYLAGCLVIADVAGMLCYWNLARLDTSWARKTHDALGFYLTH